MTIFGKIERNWKELWDILNSVGGAINQRTPVSGDGISVSESPSGFIIALKRDPPTQQQPTLGLKDEGSTANWRQLTVIDPSDCSQKEIWYWGTLPVAPAEKPPSSRPISTAEAGPFIPLTEK